MLLTDDSAKASVISPILQMGKLRLTQCGRAGFEQKTACLLWPTLMSHIVPTTFEDLQLCACALGEAVQSQP